MTPFKKIETAILKTMVSAFSAYYGRKLTEEETIDCKRNIDMIQSEIDSRDKAPQTIPMTKTENLVIPMRQYHINHY